MDAAQDRKYDIVLWGATGFTGRLVFEYLVQHAPKGLKWAIGGRNKSQLESVRGNVAERVDSSAEKIDILIADSLDQKSMDELVKQTRVVISTVGPFMKFGTPLVDACVRLRTHYIDSTGETPWVLSMIKKYNEAANKDGTVIVPMCGCDSIPADIGAFVVQNHVEKKYGQKPDGIYSLAELIRSAPSGGTLASMMHLMENPKESKMISDPLALVPAGLAKKSKQKGTQKFIGYNSHLKRWTVPFVMESVNRQVVQKSNYLLDYGKDNFSYTESLGMPSLLSAIIVYFSLFMFVLLASITFTRENIIKKVITKPGDGPSEEVRKKAKFNYHYFADIKGKRQYIGKMSGGEVGYEETAKMLAESGLCLALQRDKLPCGKGGGILTPATAMGAVLAERLEKVGLGVKIN